MAEKDALRIDEELKKSLCQAIDEWISPVEGVKAGFREIRDRYSRRAVSIMGASSLNLTEPLDVP